MPIDPKLAEDALARVRAQIDALDHDTMTAVMGVCEALNELAQALEEVDACLDERRLEAAALLGYRSVSSGYVFLQRTLGELNKLECCKAGIIQDLAKELRCAYEEISPHVDALMQSTRVRGPVTLGDAREYQAAMAKLRPTHANDLEPAQPSSLMLDRTLGFGSAGWRKAHALLHAVERTADDGPLPEDTRAAIARESERLGVTSSQLIQAAIANWLETNPKRARAAG